MFEDEAILQSLRINSSDCSLCIRMENQFRWLSFVLRSPNDGPDWHSCVWLPTGLLVKSFYLLFFCLTLRQSIKEQRLSIHPNNAGSLTNRKAISSSFFPFKHVDPSFVDWQREKLFICLNLLWILEKDSVDLPFDDHYLLDDRSDRHIYLSSNLSFVRSFIVQLLFVCDLVWEFRCLPFRTTRFWSVSECIWRGREIV